MNSKRRPREEIYLTRNGPRDTNGYPLACRTKLYLDHLDSYILEMGLAVARVWMRWSEGWWRGQDLNLRPLGYELTVGLVSYSLV